MYFGCFQFEAGRDEIIWIKAASDREAAEQFMRLWSRGVPRSRVIEGWLFESKGRLIRCATILHSLDD